jgi:hypothetical protein
LWKQLIEDAHQRGAEGIDPCVIADLAGKGKPERGLLSPAGFEEPTLPRDRG